MFSEPADHGLGRSRGGLTSKTHLAVEQGQKPLSVVITAGQRGDSPQFERVLETIRVPRLGLGRPRKRPNRVRADKAYDSRTGVDRKAPCPPEVRRSARSGRLLRRGRAHRAIRAVMRLPAGSHSMNTLWVTASTTSKPCRPTRSEYAARSTGTAGSLSHTAMASTSWEGLNAVEGRPAAPTEHIGFA
ncbi:transposase [Streptomyces sp. NPDC013012]|uniref:transposase n=1 Tax=Streptomyces sp. NPDC013012 TaxID=3364860 RepID=UPI003699B1FE